MTMGMPFHARRASGRLATIQKCVAGWTDRAIAPGLSGTRKLLFSRTISRHPLEVVPTAVSKFTVGEWGVAESSSLIPPASLLLQKPDIPDIYGRSC
jgi:hypothetical protein